MVYKVNVQIPPPAMYMRHIFYITEIPYVRKNRYVLCFSFFVYVHKYCMRFLLFLVHRIVRELYFLFIFTVFFLSSTSPWDVLFSPLFSLGFYVLANSTGILILRMKFFLQDRLGQTICKWLYQPFQSRSTRHILWDDFYALDFF